MTLQQLPKVELHLHLDCSLSFEVVNKIDPSITEEIYQHDFIAPEKCLDLVDFLKRAVKGFSLMQTKEALQLVVQDVFKQLKADNTIYAEIRFAPFLHLEKGLTAYEVVETIEAATAAAVKETGVEARLILCTLRHYSEEQSMATVKLVEQFKGTYVAAFDIAGDEAGCPITNHVAAFKYAHEKRPSHYRTCRRSQRTRKCLGNAGTFCTHKNWSWRKKCRRCSAGGSFKRQKNSPGNLPQLQCANIYVQRIQRSPC